MNGYFQGHYPYPPGMPGEYPWKPPMELPPGIKLAEAYVPWQKYTKTFSPGEALQKGTLFPELYRPYEY
ncbi:spore coat associated protein CotJA [Calderihabitans maritimus]|uniref:Spore coat associated protein CotJA n=1 Tax=Calderihabitans maritimus TaxID=1246530 RepID=A0A1Z5HUA5_9FIRM|nr:spore coat associated protein CotJA [Calderihabitans maritimus]GAW93104.1 hypothetical protein KKC1_22450 [Calderihabitans maritimus]